MVRHLVLSVAAAALLAGSALGNDGFAGVTATGLQFEKTDAVAMQSEDLFIGLDEIRVAYVFKNVSDADVTGVVAFPMPIVAIGTLIHSNFRFTAAKMDAENPLGFTATVDGQPVALTTERRAYRPKAEEPAADPDAPYVSLPASAEYDEPGEDITDYLTSLGIPITFDTVKIAAALDKLPEDKKKELAARQLAELDPTPDTPPELRWNIGWSIGIRHYWTQTFPKGAEVKITHRYQAAPSGGLFYWYDWTKPTKDWTEDPNGDDKKRYCIDDATGAAIKQVLPPVPDSPSTWGGTTFNIDYVLTTANTWKGPIGTFKLTLDKGAPENVLSVCMDGLQKTGPTTFVVEKTNYAPTKDLEVLVVTANPKFPEQAP